MARYSKEDSDYIVAEYSKDNNCIDTLAKKYGVPPKSIIAKLSSLGVYKRKTYLSKNGQPPVKKATLADNLGEMLKLHDFEIEQLEKLSKPLLIKLIGLYVKSNGSSHSG